MTMEMRRMGLPVEKFSSAPCDRASLSWRVFVKGACVSVYKCVLCVYVYVWGVLKDEPARVCIGGGEARTRPHSDE